MPPLITVFVPAFNEEKNLVCCSGTISAKLQEMGVAYEILVVDDGSHDGTGDLADQLSREDPKIRVVHHAVNMGIGAAFVSAVKYASGEWLILIPADLALEPDELRHYLAATPNADIVVGLRSDRSDYTLARHLVSMINIFLIRTLFRMKENQFQYISMYRIDTLHEIEIEYWKSAFFLAEVLIKAKALGKRLVEVEIKYVPRLTGTATGAKFKLVVLTVIDLFRFWLRWLWLGPQKASRQAQSKS